MDEKNTQSRKWQLTINNPIDKGLTHDNLKSIITNDNFKSLEYWAMCDEIGLEEKTPHTHIFVYCRNGIRFDRVKKLIPTAHIEFCKGTCQQNRDYIRKEGVILLNKFIKNVDGIHRTFLQFLAAIVTLTPYVLLTGGVTLGSLNGTGWVNLLIVGLVHTGVTYCLYFSAIKSLPGQKAAILSYIDPLVAVLISVTVLGEAMTPQQLAGGVLILGFTLWNEIKP